MDSHDPITSVTSHAHVTASRSCIPTEDSTHGQLWFFYSLTLNGPLSSLPIHSENWPEHGSWYVSLKKDFVDLGCCDYMLASVQPVMESSLDHYQSPE